jgi:crossover junction endodeoxyribonuclease RuvC
MKSGATIRILGVDPGTVRLGFGLLEARGSSASIVVSGIVTAPAAWDAARRLGKLAEELARIVDREHPDCLALEASFFGKNPNSLIRMGEARGMVLAIAGLRGLEVHDYPPASVKKAVTGSGGASKEQVARVLAALLPELGRADTIERLDQTDAIAVAWCHVQRRRLDDRMAAVAQSLRRAGGATR